MTASSVSLIPPGTGGVRDYANVVGMPLGAPLVELSRDSDTSALSGEWLLLHFSGYGFEKRGVPLWLVRRVRELRGRFQRIGIVFHELFASGPVWGSAFWLSGMQQRIARDLLMEADFWLTNRDDSARWLIEQRQQPAPHRVLPVFSNVGEPSAAEIEGARQPRMVVFGSSDMRRQVYEWNDGEIFRQSQALGLELHDIGPPMPEGPVARRMMEAGVKAHGKLPAEQVSTALREANYGALVYPTDYASKSGIFAAYCAHGICPVLLTENYSMHDGLRPNVHYAGGFDAIGANFIDPRVVGRAAHKWYTPHAVQAHVEALRMLASGKGG